MSDHEKRRQLELLSISNIMKTENGRAFMWRCLMNCSTFSGTFNPDAARHSFNAGLRSHGVWLDSELQEANEDLYYQMLRENR